VGLSAAVEQMVGCLAGCIEAGLLLLCRWVGGVRKSKSAGRAGWLVDTVQSESGSRAV
jgi:hypothetical protein